MGPSENLDLPSASLATLQKRAEFMRRLRGFFDARGFLEVETPLLSADTVVDEHLDPFRVCMYHDPRTPTEGPTWYLQTSPEFHMKRLLAGGANAIYQVTKAFRGAEQGSRHNPEFTMVEWYRRDDDMQAGMQLLDALCQHMLNVPPARRLPYAQAFQEHANIDIDSATDERLAQHVQETSNGDLQLDSRDDMLNYLLAELVEPQLKQPTIVYDYPPTQAALAQIRSSGDEPDRAERFELFVSGIELANGYHELCDPDEMQQRFERTNALRVSNGKPPLPVDSWLLQSMRRGLPACAGTALGFDRLFMLSIAADRLDQVVAFPRDRA